MALQPMVGMGEQQFAQIGEELGRLFPNAKIGGFGTGPAPWQRLAVPLPAVDQRAAQGLLDIHRTFANDFPLTAADMQAVQVTREPIFGDPANLGGFAPGDWPGPTGRRGGLIQYSPNLIAPSAYSDSAPATAYARETQRGWTPMWAETNNGTLALSNGRIAVPHGERAAFYGAHEAGHAIDAAGTLNPNKRVAEMFNDFRNDLWKQASTERGAGLLRPVTGEYPFSYGVGPQVSRQTINELMANLGATRLGANNGSKIAGALRAEMPVMQQYDDLIAGARATGDFGYLKPGSFGKAAGIGLGALAAGLLLKHLWDNSHQDDRQQG